MRGNLNDPDSLQHVVKYIESIFLMGTPFEDGIEGEIRRGKLVADIAKENKIEHLVYSSVVNADKNTGIPHFESKYKVEQYIKNLGIPYTIIGPTFFMENLTQSTTKTRTTAGSTRFTFISVNHITTNFCSKYCRILSDGNRKS